MTQFNHYTTYFSVPDRYSYLSGDCSGTIEFSTEVYNVQKTGCDWSGRLRIKDITGDCPPFIFIEKSFTGECLYPHVILDNGQYVSYYNCNGIEEMLIKYRDAKTTDSNPEQRAIECNSFYDWFIKNQTVSERLKYECSYLKSPYSLNWSETVYFRDYGSFCAVARDASRYLTNIKEYQMAFTDSDRCYII